MIEDHILEELKAQTAGDYEVLGPLASSREALSVLAQTRATGRLVLFLLERGEEDEFDLHILEEVNNQVGSASRCCPRCDTAGVPWVGSCSSCGEPLGQAAPALAGHTDEELLESVGEAIEGDLLGVLRTGQGGAPIFFTRTKNERLSGYTLWRDEKVADDEFHLVQIWKDSSASKGASSTPSASTSQTVEPPAKPETRPVKDSKSEASAPPPKPEPWFQDEAPEAPAEEKRSPWLLIGGAVGVAALGLFLLNPFRGSNQTPPPVSNDVQAEAPSQPVAQDVLDTTTSIDVEETPVPAAEQETPPPSSTPTETPAPPQTGTLVIEGDFPSGTRISVNGSPVQGNTIERRPGRYTFAVSAPGFFPATAEYTVRAGETQRWRPTLRRLTSQTEEDPASSDPPAEDPPANTGNDVPPNDGTQEGGEESATPAGNPTTAILAAMETYRQALESHDMARLRQAFFGIPPSEEERWEPFFEQFTEGRFSDLRVGLDAADPVITPEGDRAEVTFFLSLSYTDPNGSPPGRPIPLRAVLRGSDQGWLLLRIDPGEG